jgi:hypothetical protein
VLVEFAPSVKLSVIEDVVELEEVIVGGDGAGAETAAVLENASVEPLAFTAVTLQRIGLRYPKLKKLDGGVYVDKVLAPGALM